MNAPCKDCSDRVVGCHGTCEKYQAFRKERDEFIEKMRMINSAKFTDKSWFIRDKWRKEKAKR